MDAKQAAAQEKANMTALGDPVFLTYTGKNMQMVGGKLKLASDEINKERVLYLGFLGGRYEFTAGKRQQVPRKAAEHWMRDNQTTWENKVEFILEEGADMVPASEVAAQVADLQAQLEAAKAQLAAAKAKEDEEGDDEPEVAPTTEAALMLLKKDGLQDIASKLGVEVDPAAKKADLVASILKAQLAAAKAGS